MATETSKIKDPKLRWLKNKYATSGAAYFKESAVQSATGFITVAGTILAKPYSTGAPKKQRVPAPFPGQAAPATVPATGKSEYGQHFVEKRFCYSSMDNKPLSTYDPLAYRSRNAVADVKMPYKNSSVVDMDQGLHVCKKRQYCTTQKNCYKGHPTATLTNPGILSDQYKKNQFFLNL